MTTVYDFTVQKPDGKKESLAIYKGQILLIVNTASKCGFAPQFEGLEELYKTYEKDGFTVLGFPSDQFKQEYQNMQDTLDYCQMNYGVTFPVFDKIKVNGSDQSPLYQFLKEQKKGMLTEDIKWNFTKFLVDREGQVIKRYAPSTPPEKIGKEVAELMKED